MDQALVATTFEPASVARAASGPRMVVMVAIPGRVQRGARTRTDLSYVPYGRATWEWWCRSRGADFVLVEEPVTRHGFADAPPPMQRWMAVERLLLTGAAGTRIVVVDADTMIRWDAPDIFDAAGDSLGAVLDSGSGRTRWAWRSIAAYQRFFPDVEVRWWEYFNSGLVIFNKSHAPILTALIELYERHRPQLEAIQQQSDVGIDQTLLNFVVQQRRAPLRLLPMPFNLIDCLALPLTLRLQFDAPQSPEQRQALLARILKVPETFDFIDQSYVWHFTSPVSVRAEFMRETWLRLREHYPGAVAPA
jgi:hypothetical protein